MIAAPAVAQPCTSAKVAPDQKELPVVWRTALDELIAATTDPDKPWGCGRAMLRLTVGPNTATLEVRDGQGRWSARDVDVAEDVVPTGKAMLASAMPPPPPIVPLSDIPKAVDTEPAPPARLVFNVSGAARYVGITSAIALGVDGRAIVPIERWSIGLGLRYTLIAADLGTRPGVEEFDYAELTIGGGVGYAFVTEPLRVRLMLLGAVALVDMEVEEPGPEELEVESGAVDGRVGTELSLSVPIWGPFQLAAALGADIAPASLANADRRIQRELPPMPAYTVGAALGLEIAIR